jgi:Gluconate 2-dehydrogenase subunit 3
MQRREAIKILMGTAVLPLLPNDVFGLLQQAHKDLSSTGTLKILNPHQDATITTLAEWIIPQTSTPGAKAVRVNEFIDLILSDWMDQENRTEFLSGLADVDVQSRAAFGKNFVDCTTAEQKQMLTVWDEELTELRESERLGARRRRTRMPVDKSFFRGMKQLTLVGYFTSEEGAKRALHYEIIPSQHVQCAPMPEEEEATT